MVAPLHSVVIPSALLFTIILMEECSIFVVSRHPFVQHVSAGLCQPSRRCLRSAARGDLVVPATRTVCYGPRSFAVAGPATWNSLPASLRDDQLSVAAFRRLLKTELFARAYDSTLARSWLLLTVRVGEHNFNYYYTTTTTLQSSPETCPIPALRRRLFTGDCRVFRPSLNALLKPPSASV